MIRQMNDIDAIDQVKIDQSLLNISSNVIHFLYKLRDLVERIKVMKAYRKLSLM